MVVTQCGYNTLLGKAFCGQIVIVTGYCTARRIDPSQRMLDELDRLLDLGLSNSLLKRIEVELSQATLVVLLSPTNCQALPKKLYHVFLNLSEFSLEE